MTFLYLWLIGSIFFVYYDASKNKIGKIPDEKGFFNLSADNWALATFLLWIIIFPAYLMKRSKLVEKAKEKPQESSARRLKLGIICAIFVAGLLIPLFHTTNVGTITFAESVDLKTMNTTNEGTHFSPGEVTMIVKGTKPFADTKLITYVSIHENNVWNVLEENTVNAEWDIFTAPLLLIEKGIYDIEVTTSKGDKVAKGTIYVE